jgi:signal transduction histidine kinase
MNTIFRLSLRAKIALCVGVSILLISVAGVLFTRQLMITELREELEERGRSMAQSLEDRSVDHILRGNFFDLHHLIQETSTNSKDVRYVFVLDPRGNVIDHTFESGFPVDLRLLLNPGSGEEYRSQLLRTEEGFIRDIAVPVFDGKAGFLHVGMSEGYIESTVSQALFKLFIGSGIALLAGVALSWFIVGFITRPVLRLVNVADAVRGGDLASRASITTQDEIGRLGTAFDAMTQELSTKIDELYATNIRLAALNELANLSSRPRQMDSLLSEIIGKLLSLVQADAGGILFERDERGSGYSVYTGFSQVYVRGVDELMFNSSSRVRKRILDRATYPASEFGLVEPRLLSLVENDEFHIFASAPIFIKEDMAGAIHVARRMELPFTPREQELLLSVAAQVGTMLTNRQLLKEASQAEALRYLNQMKSEFAVQASHELRTPATAIKGYIETLLRPDMALDGNEKNQILEDMNDVTDRLNRLIQDVLNVARIDSRTQDIRKDKIILRPLLHRIVQRLGRQSSRHHLVVEIDENVGHIFGDEDRLEDILENLISNAAKFSPSGGTITVSARNSILPRKNEQFQNVNPSELGTLFTQFATISVKDEGIGIAAEEIPNLFQQFYQITGESVTRTGGIGMGLYICKSYVEAMGGKIWVDSDKNKGSTFSFTIPAIELMPKQIPKRGRLADLAKRRR